MISFHDFNTDEEELDEAMTAMQRKAVARRMKRLAPKIRRAKERKKKRLATRDAITLRAMRAAREILTKKLSGGKAKAELSIQQRIMVSQKLSKKSAVIAKIAKKLMPKMIRAEKERLTAYRLSQQTPGQ